MKHKFSSMGRVAIALVLALSLSLVMAVPAAADSPADTDVGYTLSKSSDGTATWADNSGLVTGLPAGGLGNYSVNLTSTTTGTGDLHVELIPAAGITVSDLDDATGGDFGFWYYVEQTLGDGPNLELKFEDPDSTDYADITLMLQNKAVLQVWTEADLDTSYGNVGIWAGEDIGAAGQTLQEGIDALIAACEGSADWELTTVQAESFTANNAITYVDDITIAGVTYELEPIFLDAEYYSVGDTVEVTVPNFAANTDSFRINPVADEIEDPLVADNWTVSVNSDSDPDTDIIVALEETGADTGVFTASFGTSGTTPVAADELYVEDGATITVTYDASVDPYWGAGASPPVTSIDVKVDDTAPEITVVSPLDDSTTDDATPVISASYSDAAGSGIDLLSVEMFVDDVKVTATAGASAVTYTPTEDLAEGSHNVTVNVSDKAGNAALTKSWSFRIASWLEGSPVSSDPEKVDSLDELDTVDLGLAVTITGDEGIITVGRYASNPQPEAPPTFDMIEDGFFDAKVTNLAGTATQIVIKFADPAITAESTAHVWDELEGAWLECSDQGYNPTDEFLWVKVRVADTTPNISELTGTPFAISGEPAEEDPMVYDANEDGVIQKSEAVAAVWDYFDGDITKGLAIAVVWLYFE